MTVLGACVEESWIWKEEEYLQNPEHENKKFAPFQCSLYLESQELSGNLSL